MALNGLYELVKGTDPKLDQYAVNYELGAFIFTGHAVFAWRAYRRARETNLPIPPPVLLYFDKCADAVEHNGTAAAITTAMQLRPKRGGAGTSKRTKAIERQRELLDHLWAEYRNWVLKKEGAAATKKAARERVAQRMGTTAGRLYQLERKWLRYSKNGKV